MSVGDVFPFVLFHCLVNRKDVFNLITIRYNEAGTIELN